MNSKNVLDRDFRLNAATESGRREDGAPFRPLFQRASGAEHPQDDSKQQRELTIAHAREKGYQNGLKRGREEALAMLRESLKPGLNDFFAICKAAAGLNQHVERHVCTSMTELAAAIAEQVLGAPVGIPLDRLQASVREILVQANRISLYIHPHDLQKLRTAFDDAGLDWPENLDLLLRGHDAMQIGEVRVEAHAGLASSMNEQITQRFAELLSETSTLSV